MKIAKSQLKRIIKEEISKVLFEQLTPEQYLERIKKRPDLINDLVAVALNDPDVIGGMPEWMTPVYATDTLLKLGQLVGMAPRAPQGQNDWYDFADELTDRVG